MLKHHYIHIPVLSCGDVDFVIETSCTNYFFWKYFKYRFKWWLFRKLILIGCCWRNVDVSILLITCIVAKQINFNWRTFCSVDIMETSW